MYAYREYAIKKYLASEKLDIPLKKSTLENIYYKWRNNSKIFSFFSIFDNYETVDKEVYLRDQKISYILDIYHNKYF